MTPRPIGIVAGGGGPLGAAAVMREIILECQRQQGSWRSYEYPCINFYSFPYSEMLLSSSHSVGIPARELGYCIQQLKLMGMEIIVVPCFTMSSYLTYRNYGVELIEVGRVLCDHLRKEEIHNPLILCSERTRQSGYCDKHFVCHYPSWTIQKELNELIEDALQGKVVNVKPLLAQLPDVPIVCAMTTLNAQMQKLDDKRWINPNKLLAKYVVQRSYSADSEKSVLAAPRAARN